MPFAAGGTADIVARLAGEKLSRAFGQSVVIDNRPGAGSTLGAAEVAKSAADGYTLLMITPTHLIASALYKNLGYDPVATFEPVAMLATGPFAMVVNPAVKAGNLREVITLTQANPGVLTYGSSGNGSSQHLAGRLFETVARVELLHVPYKGSNQVTADLIGGTVQLAFMGLPNALPHLRSGKLRALAVTSTTRWPELPAVPTMEQAGLPGYQMSSWIGLVAPAKTNAAIIARVHAALGQGMQAPDVKQAILASGAEVGISSPAEFSAYLSSESKRWLELARVSRIAVE